MVAMGFVIAHVVHILAYNYHLFEEDWTRILPWYGGYSSIGGMLGAGIAIPLFLKGIRKVPLWPYLDNLCIGFMLGYFMGRAGCFTAHDHIGAQTGFFLAVDFFFFFFVVDFDLSPSSSPKTRSQPLTNFLLAPV